MKKLISKFLDRIGVLHHFQIFKEKYFPSKYYINSQKDLNRYVDFYSQFINENDLCFDIGAHRGHRTEVFLHMKGKVIAIEPQTDLYKYLKAKYKNKAIVENIGLGSEQTNKTMFISEMSSLSTFSEEWLKKAGNRFKNVKWHKGNIIRIDTLDNLINKYGEPKFCKIDVEGFEYEVLKGLSHSIPVISIEYMTPENNEIIESCLDYLYKLNSEILVNYSPGDEMKLSLRDWLEYTPAIKYLRHNVFNKPGWGDIYIKMS
jgi:FkbM family methyltransferase